MAQGSIVLPLNGGAAKLEGADAGTASAGPFGRTLRIALAMKGGVSLAVWIGGAVAELDVLRRVRIVGERQVPRAVLLTAWPDGGDDAVIAEHEQVIVRATAYARLLVSRRYDAVEFDVLAGASAGGLNAVMYAVAQRFGTTTDSVLRLWLDSGDAWRLMRCGGARSIGSVLRGDEYFWGAMQTALRQLHSEPHHPGLAAPVSVDLSATVIDAQDSSERGTREGKAHFHFSGGLPTDLAGRIIPDREHVQREAALERLAYAARSTSSFPGAFEPALIYSGIEAAPGDAVDMREAFHAHRKRRPAEPKEDDDDRGWMLDPFRVVDGGVTDNVPIDRALRAIRSRPADRYVDRALLYLDPSPKLEFDFLLRPITYHGSAPAQRAPAASRKRRDDRRSDFLSVVPTAIGHMLGRESKDDEVDDVERFRLQLSLEQGKDEAFAPLTQPPITRARGGPPHVAAAYARYRAAADLELLSQALIEPSVWLLPTTQPRAAPDAWTREQLLLLDSALDARFGDLEPDELAGVRLGTQAQVDACRCLIAWMRALEDGAFGTPLDEQAGIAVLDALWGGDLKHPSRAALRGAIYRAQSIALRARDAGILHVLSAAAARKGDDAMPRPLAEAIVETWIVCANRSPVGGGIWSELDAIVRDLRAVSAQLSAYEAALALVPPDDAPPTYLTGWSQSPWSGIGQSEDSFEAVDLAPLVAAKGLPLGMRAMEYADITAGEARAADAFPTLREAQMLSGYRSLLRMRTPDLRELAAEAAAPGGTIDRMMPLDRLQPRAKLAGVGLANFAGFLSREWRTNDWWWGRLDAARGMAGFLGSFALPQGVADPPDAKPVVEHAVLEQWRLASAESASTASSTFRAQLGTGVGGIAALAPSYRVALGSRLLRLLSRALVGGAGPVAPQRVALWLLRPLLVFVPALLDAPRAAIVAALVIAPSLILVEPAAGNPWVWTVLVALGLISTALVVAGFAQRTFRTLAVQAALDDQRKRHVASALHRALWVGLVLGVGAIVLASGALLWLLQGGRVEPATWVLLATSVVLAIAARARYLQPRVPTGRHPARAVVGFGVAALLAGGAWLGRGSIGDALSAWHGEPGMDSLELAAMVAVLGALVAAVLAFGWLGGFASSGSATRAAALLVLFLTALAAGTAAGAPFLLGLLEQEWITVTGCALAALWLWGTVLWWLPTILQPEYAPDDRPARRRVPRE